MLQSTSRPLLATSFERKHRMALLRGRIKALTFRIRTLERRRLPMIDELQALVFRASAEYEMRKPFRDTTGDREADDVQVWLLRRKRVKA